MSKTGEHKVVLCVDPQTGHSFRLNLETNEIAIEKDSDPRKYEAELNRFEYLKGFSRLSWSFESEATHNFRRRAMQRYLLHKDPSDNPCYLIDSELSSAFADVSDLKLHVDISNYCDPQTAEKVNPVEIRASLVTGANEIIRTLIRRVYRETKVKLIPEYKTNQLVFKIEGVREYLTGNHPMLSYKQVRTALRGHQYCNVILTEVAKKNEKFFPPLFTLPKGADPMTEPLESQSNNPIIIWYPPRDIRSILNWEEDPEPRELLKRPRAQATRTKQPSQVREQELAKMLTGSRGEMTSLQYSGECDWPFRLRIWGVETLYSVFPDAINGNATYNGEVTPEFVTKPAQDKKEKKKKRKKNRCIFFRKAKPVHLKAYRRSTQQSNVSSRNISGTSFSNHFNHGPNCPIPQDLKANFNLPFTPYLMNFEVMLCYGDDILKECKQESNLLPFGYNSRLYQWMKFPLKVSEIPKETRICINVFVHGIMGEKQGEKLCIGWSSISLFDELGNQRTGLQTLQLWPFYRIEPRLAWMEEYWGTVSQAPQNSVNESSASPQYGTRQSYIRSLRPSVVQNLSSFEYAKVSIQLDSFVSENVSWSLRDQDFMHGIYSRYEGRTTSTEETLNQRIMSRVRTSSIFVPLEKDLSLDDPDLMLIHKRATTNDLASLQSILIKDPLMPLTDKDKEILFICRDHYKSLPLMLQKFLQSVDWSRPQQVEEAHRMLKKWSPVPPEDALALLNANFPDENVRLYAVNRISHLSDEDIAMYMIQLSQILMFETQHLSPLAELLIERALRNPHVVGHELYWVLKSQLYFKVAQERFGLILEQFLMLWGSYRNELEHETKMNDIFGEWAASVVNLDSKNLEDRVEWLRSAMKDWEPEESTEFPLSIDNRNVCSTFMIEDCKVMSSKKLPIWLRMKSSEGKKFDIIFKKGDDLRQDIMSLQMICVMDKIWLDSGIDLRMKPYRVVATDDQVGMVEVVGASRTISSIQKKYSGRFGAFSSKPLEDFLREHNNEEDAYEKAIDNFIRSCAGYCVATYILGIGDRHNSNIMLTETGHLFHIDFGHFLGNFKSKFGIKRERSKFVFTDAMLHVMGGRGSDGFETFTNYCTRAYNLVRKNGWRIITLFQLMISAGIPELSTHEDINYLVDQLALHLTEIEANNLFKKQINSALNNTFRKFDALIHDAKH